MSDERARKDWEQADQAGESARRAGRGIDTCPKYGMGEAARRQCEAWRNGWERVDASRKVAK